MLLMVRVGVSRSTAVVLLYLIKYSPPIILKHFVSILNVSLGP